VVDQHGQGWRGNPSTGWRAEMLSVLPWHEISEGAGNGELFRPEQSGYTDLSSIPGYSFETLGIPHKVADGRVISPYWKSRGCGIAWGWEGITTMFMVTWNESTHTLYAQGVEWSGVLSGGWTATSPVVIDFGNHENEPEAGWIVIPLIWGVHRVLFLNEPGSDTIRSYQNIDPPMASNDSIGEIMQWTVNPSVPQIKVIVQRHADHGLLKAGWYAGHIFRGDYISPRSGVLFVQYEHTPHESVQHLPGGAAVRTVDTGNPTGYKWSATVKNDDGTAVLWVYDDNWQLLDKIDFGQVYPPDVSDPDSPYRNYFGATAQADYIIHEDRIYGYGNTTAPAVRVDRHTPDSDNKLTWVKLLDDTCRQIFCGWWIRPDQRLRVKPLYSGELSPRDADKLVETARWGYWNQNKNKIELSYGTNGGAISFGLPGISKEIRCPLTSTRSMAKWLALQWWAMLCSGRSEATLGLRLYCTEIYNRLLYGAEWCITRLEIFHARDQIYSTIEAITKPTDIAGVLHAMPKILSVLTYNPNNIPPGWMYPPGAPATFFLCEDHARALLDLWCALLNSASPPITYNEAAEIYLMDNAIEWITLAEQLHVCMEVE
jgi:hypothetical protein